MQCRRNSRKVHRNASKTKTSEEVQENAREQEQAIVIVQSRWRKWVLAKWLCAFCLHAFQFDSTLHSFDFKIMLKKFMEWNTKEKVETHKKLAGLQKFQLCTFFQPKLALCRLTRRISRVNLCCFFLLKRKSRKKSCKQRKNVSNNQLCTKCSATVVRVNGW